MLAPVGNDSIKQTIAMPPSIAPNILKDLDFPSFYEEYGKKIRSEFGNDQIMQQSNCLGEFESIIEMKDPIAKSIAFLKSIIEFWREVDNQNMLDQTYLSKFYINLRNKNQIAENRQNKLIEIYKTHVVYFGKSEPVLTEIEDWEFEMLNMSKEMYHGY